MGDNPTSDKKFFDQLILSAARQSAYRKDAAQGRTGKAHNAMCGDVVEIGFTGSLHQELHHAGEGCILSQAFAAVACKEFVGLDKSAIELRVKQLSDFLAGGDSKNLPAELAASGFAAASSVVDFTTRHPCIMLFAKSFEDAWRKQWNESLTDQQLSLIHI